jgi:L-alanine-DL-glutamate epimerase-like enolase superfamily enzyme
MDTQTAAARPSSERSSAIRLECLECFAVDIAPRHDIYVMSHGRFLRSFSSTVVRVIAEDGTDGLGEACLLGANYGDGFAASARVAIAELAPWVLTQNPLEAGAIVDGMDAQMIGQLAAKAAIDAALWDLRGKLFGQPVACLLGGVRQRRLGAFQAISLDDPQAMAAEIEAVGETGTRRWQLKLGDDPMVDAQRTRAAAAALPTGSSFLASDANRGWTPAQALRFVRAIGDVDTYLEQPCATTDEVARVRAHTSLPIMLDESVLHVSDLVRAIMLNAVDAINLKPTRVGGLTKAARLRDVAQACGLMVLVDEPQGAGLATAAMAQLGATIAPNNFLGASYFAPAGDHTLIEGAITVDTVTPGLGARVGAADFGEPLFRVEREAE